MKIETSSWHCLCIPRPFDIGCNNRLFIIESLQLHDISEVLVVGDANLPNVNYTSWQVLAHHGTWQITDEWTKFFDVTRYYMQIIWLTTWNVYSKPGFYMDLVKRIKISAPMGRSDHVIISVIVKYRISPDDTNFRLQEKRVTWCTLGQKYGWEYGLVFFVLKICGKNCVRKLQYVYYWELYPTDYQKM